MSASRRIVLASRSPRRSSLLASACFDVTVIDHQASEDWPGGDLERAAVLLAERKAASIPAMPDCILAADTVVELDGEPLGKPTDTADAASVLRRLSGREHRVVTGFCLRRGGELHSQAVVTRVWFRKLCATEIDRYVASGDPMDKAGAYGIQGMGGAFVDRVEGSFTNVMGLPLAEVVGAWERTQ